MKIVQIVGWSAKQSYKDRRPSWVKLHRTLLDSFEFHQMGIEARAMLPMFWLLASENPDPKAGCFAYNIETIAFRLRVNSDVIRKSLQDCEKFGFLQVIDSKGVPQTLRFEHTETEKETDSEAETEAEKETEGSRISLLIHDETHQPKNQTETAVAMWQKMAEETGVPKIRGMTDARKKALRLRLRDIGGLDAWAEAMDRIRQSQFCQGKNDRGWQISFSKILQPNILTNLLEGVYADKPRFFTSEAERMRTRNEEFDRHLAALEAKMNGGQHE